MRETVTLESSQGDKLGKADIFSSVDHYPDQILVTLERPQVFRLHRVTKGHLVYRPSEHYISPAENFRK